MHSHSHYHFILWSALPSNFGLGTLHSPSPFPFIMALGFLISALILPVAASIDHIHDPDWRAFKSKFRKTLRTITGRENCMCCCRIRGYLYHCIREFSPNMIQRWAVLVAWNFNDFGAQSRIGLGFTVNEWNLRTSSFRNAQTHHIESIQLYWWFMVYHSVW